MIVLLIRMIEQHNDIGNDTNISFGTMIWNCTLVLMINGIQIIPFQSQQIEEE